MACSSSDLDLTIYKGKTFVKVLRWEANPIIYRPISGVPSLAPLRLTVATHGVPDGWRIAITDVGGMTEINASSEPPRDDEYVQATVVDTNTLEINSINASSYRAYTSGGVIRYNTPVPLSGYTAEMQIKDKVGGTELLSLVSPTDIDIDDVAFTITITIDAATTAAITWLRGVYELEMTSPGGSVLTLVKGRVSVVEEIVT